MEKDKKEEVKKGLGELLGEIYKDLQDIKSELGQKKQEEIPPTTPPTDNKEEETKEEETKEEKEEEKEDLDFTDEEIDELDKFLNEI